VLSSRIEGTQTNLADLYAYEAGQLPLLSTRPAPPESDVREVLNYVRALEYGLERVNTLPVSLRLIRELHTHLMENARGGQATPGEFRCSQNWIGQRDCTLNDATFVPPPTPDMLAALDEFEKYLHGECVYPPLVRLGLVHYQFEAIHPFLDGNGRIGRLVISLLLVNWNLLPLPLLYLSAYFERNRNSYYDLLLAVSERGAWRDWLMFFLRGVDEQARDAITRAKQLQDLKLEWRKRLQLARTTGLALGIVDMLFESPVISAKDVIDRFEVSHQAAMQALRRLEKLGLLCEATGRRRHQSYMAKEIVQAIE
jgi:Fic family protein